MAGSNSAYPLFTSNFVLQASSRFHHWEGDGPLSIKTFSNGRAFYKVNRGYFAVEEEAYLLLNERQAYTISIESPAKVDSFCIFFKRNFAEETSRALQTEPSRLLDDPFLANANPVEFYEKTYTNDLLLTPYVDHLKKHYPLLGHNQLWLEEQFHNLMHALLKVHHKTALEAKAAFPAVRPSTREELYRRIHVAHEYIHAYYRDNVSLDVIAKVACLSPNHLLRMYRMIFKMTPYQHIIEKRLLEAMRLLNHSTYSVTEISLQIGFEHVTSFNKMFKQRTGISPQQYRKR